MQKIADEKKIVLGKHGIYIKEEICQIHFCRKLLLKQAGHLMNFRIL